MQPNYLTIKVIASMIINEIEKRVINILPTSSIEFDEIDYSILEKRRNDWIKLSEVTHTTLINSFLFLIIFLNYMDLTPVGCLFMDISQLLRLYIRTI